MMHRFFTTSSPTLSLRCAALAITLVPPLSPPDHFPIASVLCASTALKSNSFEGWKDVTSSELKPPGGGVGPVGATSTALQPHGVVASTGASTEASTKLVWHGVIEPDKVKSASKWVSVFSEQLVDPLNDPTLALPTGAPLTQSACVFAELVIDDAVLLIPPNDRCVSDHCEIGKVMKRMNLLVTNHDGVVLPDSKVLTDNLDMLKEMAIARRLEHARERNEKVVDACARQFLVVNGLNKDDLTIRSLRGNFTIFGKPCYAEADHFVINNTMENIIVLVEDKWYGEGSKLAADGHVAQIVCEMLHAASTNYAKKKVHDIFAIRVVNYHVSFFRLVLSGQVETLESLIKTDDKPKKKLLLLCSHANPESNFGLSLIDKAERRLALQIMADIRRYTIDIKR
jgi:hypothetical protein